MSNSTLTPNINKQQWAQAADNAKDAAASVGEMAGHAASAVGEMASQAASNVGNKVDNLTASAGIGIQGLGDKLSDHTPHDGMLGTASQAVAKSVRDGGKYVEDAKLSGMTEDFAQLVRRYPIPAVLVAIGVGCFMNRIMRR
ncbi:MAG: hypothetical protein ACKVT0_13110 [Planctomycetaceae bacterium]